MLAGCKGLGGFWNSKGPLSWATDFLLCLICSPAGDRCGSPHASHPQTFTTQDVDWEKSGTYGHVWTWWLVSAFIVYQIIPWLMEFLGSRWPVSFEGHIWVTFQPTILVSLNSHVAINSVWLTWCHRVARSNPQLVICGAGSGRFHLLCAFFQSAGDFPVPRSSIIARAFQ